MKLDISRPRAKQTERFEGGGNLPAIELECLANLEVYESEEG